MELDRGVTPKLEKRQCWFMTFFDYCIESELHLVLSSDEAGFDTPRSYY